MVEDHKYRVNVFNAIIKPNIREWFVVRTTEFSRSKDGEKILAESIEIKYFDKYDSNKEKVLVVVISGSISHYKDRSNFEKNYNSTHRFHGPSAIPLKALLADTPYSYNEEYFKALYDTAKEHQQFKQLFNTLDVPALIQKRSDASAKQKTASQKTAALKFGVNAQLNIANVLLHLIISRTDNYLCRIFAEQLNSGNTDYSGKKLADALSIFNLKKEDIINTLINSDSPEARRFAALFSEVGAVALLDNNPQVRLAAKIRQEKE